VQVVVSVLGRSNDTFHSRGPIAPLIVVVRQLREQFAVMEAPDLLAEDIQGFFRSLFF